MIGVAALNSTLLQEKMAGNTKDSNVAFQAAEAGLRDAEADVVKNVTSATLFTSSCTNGLCTPPSTWPTPTSVDISKAVDWGNAAKVRVYGSQTGAPALADVAAQPLYVIEKLSSLAVAPGGSAGIGLHAAQFRRDRISPDCPRDGARLESHVILQSTFIVSGP